MSEVEFIPAEKLKQQFYCLGHFYSLVFGNGTEIPCRSLLEILRKDTFHGAVSTEITDLQSDALVIMMNPGSSRPLDPEQGGAAVSAHEIETGLATQPLVPTVPDTTQYQIMRLMLLQNWQHVRIVNLSDLRNADSNRFVQEISLLEKLPSGAVHSIFSNARRNEWKARLSLNNGPVIAGWGQHPGLEKLAEYAVQSMAGQELTGIAVARHPLRFAHPSPRNHSHKVRWLVQMAARFRPQSASF
ncbi:MAG: hypothetical protein DRJ14_04875 [Acidobacteria bacterium]|nr:MAG: hypothetical protein DRJ14_04875 [Acidobacteriota bacterium]